MLLPRELNSGMKFDKSTAEAWRLNQTFELSSALKFNKLCRATRLWHGSDSNVVLLLCRTQFRNEVRQKHSRSTASESNFRIKFGTQLSSTSSAVLHDSGTAAIQTSCFCCAELNSGMKFDKSTAEARRLNQTFELSSALN